MIDAVACDIKLNAVYLVILRVLHDMTDACGFGLNFQIENNGIFRTRHHCLLAGVTPNEDVAVDNRDVFMCRNTNSAFNHLLGSESILIAASRYGNAACTKPNIRQRVVGIGQRKTVIVCCLIVFQGVDFC